MLGSYHRNTRADLKAYNNIEELFYWCGTQASLIKFGKLM